MDTISQDQSSFIQHQLVPFEYHKKLRDHFKNKKKTWDWFAEDDNKNQQIEEFRSNLLKNTYRLDRESHEKLYLLIDEARAILAIDAEVTLYQENNSVQLNAGISIIEKEAHIVLSGNLLSLLSDDELKALLAHELSHYLFYKVDDEEFEITQRIVLALANDSRSEDAIIETARIFQLYMELFCDIGSLKVCKDFKTVVQMLVKLNTGLSQVNAESYLAQAKEIVRSDSTSTQNNSHPESYIRCLALKQYQDNPLDYISNIKKLIEGELDLNQLDIFEQVDMQKHTRHLLQLLLVPDWMNSSAITSLSKQYFSDFYRDVRGIAVADLAKILESARFSVKSYIAYVLLDFSMADKDMEGAPMGYTLELSELLGIKDLYEKVIRKELKLSVRDFKLMQDRVMNELQLTKENQANSLYDD